MAAFARGAAGRGISKLRITGGEPLVRRAAPISWARSRAPGGRGHRADDEWRPAAPRRRVGGGGTAARQHQSGQSRRRGATRGSHAAATSTTRSPAWTRPSPPASPREDQRPVAARASRTSLRRSWRLTREREVHVRFIEFMPLDRRLGRRRSPGAGRRDPCSACAHPPGELAPPTKALTGHGPAADRHVPGSRGTIGFIAGVSEHFCAELTGRASPPTAVCAPACSRGARSTSGRC